MTDDALLRRYAADGDAGAFCELVERYADLVYATCLRVTRNPHDAEDAAQECFLALARKARSIRASAARWLHATARNASLAIATRKRVLKEREADMASNHCRDASSDWASIESLIDETCFTGDDAKKIETNIQANAFCYHSLIDARASAARYLRSIAGEVPPESREHLLTAADTYDEIAEKLRTGLRNVHYPWDLKGKPWTVEERRAESAILTQVLALEKRAVADVERALASMQD